jgi:hypothetical protein
MSNSALDVIILTVRAQIHVHKGSSDDDDDVYLNKLQTKGVKKCILYM